MDHVSKSRTLAALLVLPACMTDLSGEEGSRSLAIGNGARPNVVVVMVDDLDVRSMETMLDLGLAPNIQRYLINQGTTFSSAFVSNALCCPSRATMLTGQYSHNNGVLSARPASVTGGVDALDDSSTLVTWLQAVGYRTGHIGKYLNGYGSGRDDVTPSFQPEYVPPGWDHWQGTIKPGQMFEYRINDTVDGVQEIVTYGDAVEDYQTTVLARRAAAFIEDASARGGPFYLEVMPLAPHAESDADRDETWNHFVRPDPQDEIDKPEEMALIRSLRPTFLDDPSWDHVSPEAPRYVRQREPLTEAQIANVTSFYRDRLAAMLSVDDLVGDIARTLAAQGVLGSTVIIFTSDNGYVFGHHRLIGKRVAYDESIRVPLYIRVPERVHRSVSRLVVNADLAPTIADLAGAQPGLMVDGRSLMPYLSADVPAAPWRRQVLLEHWAAAPSDIPTYAGLRTSQYVYVNYYESPVSRHELYDLASDPFQLHNVYSLEEYRAVGRRLRGQLLEMQTCSNGSCQALED